MIDLSKNENTSNVLDVKDIILKLETNRYTFEQNYKLHDALAKKYNLEPDNFILGCGSSDAIFMFMLAINEKARLAKKSVEFIAPMPTFYVILDFAKALNMDIKLIHLKDDFILNVNDIKPSDDKFSIIYISNPNNPTARMLTRSDLDYLNNICVDNTYFILDEAYSEFVEDFESIKMASNPNILHARTMSKLYSIAGLRLGYGIACKDVINAMNAFYNPDRINAFALYSAIYALSIENFVEDTRKIIAKNRAMVEDEFKALDIFYYPSKTNFILHKIKDEKYRDFMLKNGIVVGNPIANHPLLNRISIGNENEVKEYIKALRLAKQNNLV